MNPKTVVWLPVALIVLLPGLTLISVELVQRARFASLEHRLDSALSGFAGSTPITRTKENRYLLASPGSKGSSLWRIDFSRSDRWMLRRREWDLNVDFMGEDGLRGLLIEVHLEQSRNVFWEKPDIRIQWNAYPDKPAKDRFEQALSGFEYRMHLMEY